MISYRLPFSIVVIALWVAAVVLSFTTTATAQTGADSAQSRILTATLPIPLPDRAEHPLPPDRLRAESPRTLSLAGTWHFQLTHGQIVDRHFALSDAAGPDDLSQSWFHAHDIHATSAKPFSGEFVLRAISSP